VGDAESASREPSSTSTSSYRSHSVCNTPIASARKPFVEEDRDDGNEWRLNTKAKL
jgi:hypothetical protein